MPAAAEVALAPDLGDATADDGERLRLGLQLKGATAAKLHVFSACSRRRAASRLA